MDSSPAEVTSLLNQLADGDQEAAARLVPLVYNELRRIAEARLRHERPDHTLQEQQKRVIDYIRSQGYFVADSEPSREVLLAHPRVAMVKGDEFSYDAVRTPMDLPIAKEVIAAVESARGKVVKWPTIGGSVPLGAMERAANTHTITVPIANHDNNQHSSNENIRLQNLWDGIETMAALMQVE